MASTIFNGTSIKLLKDILKFKAGVLIITADTDDPTSVAKSAPIGSIYVRSGTSSVYVKTDSGSSTNWNLLAFTGNYITALTGDVTASGPGSAAATLATVNANTGSFGSSTAIPNFTVNGKGLITAAGTNAVIAPAGTLTGTTLASNVVSSSLTSVGTVTSGTWTGTTIAIANGGTGQTSKATAFDALSPMSASGDIIYGGTSGTGTRLAKGSDGTVLTLASGIPSWVSPSGGASAFNITTQTTTYSAVANDYILASASSNYNITLPTAVGASGKMIAVKRTDDAPTNIITINTTSAQTIDGASSVHAVTKGETWVFVSNNVNWSVMDHKTGTGRLGGAAITFSSTGGTQAAAGTTTTNNIDYERIGIYARIHITLVQTAAGTTGQGATLITLPAGLTADTTIVPLNTNTTTPTATTPGNCMGEIWTHNGSNIAWFSPVLHSSTKLHFAGSGNSAGELVWGDGGVASMGLGNTTLSAGGWVDVPISGWEP